MGDITTLETCYDRHRDVVFAAPQAAGRLQSVPVAVDLFLLVDAATGAPVGLECVDFSRHVQDPAWLAALPPDPLFVELSKPDARLSVAEVLRQMWRDASGKGLAGQPALAVAVAAAPR